MGTFINAGPRVRLGIWAWFWQKAATEDRKTRKFLVITCRWSVNIRRLGALAHGSSPFNIVIKF